jgi:hypothetical protein
MDTDIRYLRTLELDLARAAAWAEDGVEPGGTRSARARRAGGGRRRRRWPIWSAAAAALLVGAWAIGSLVPNSQMESQGAFDEVGQAVGSTGAVDATTNPEGFEAPAVREVGQGDTWSVPQAGYLSADLAGALHSADVAGVPGSYAAVAAAELKDLSKIVRNGAISLEVPDKTFDDVFAQVVAVAQASGGMVLSSSTKGEGSGTLTLRIPASRFDQTFEAIRGLGTTLSSTSTGQDVTAQYVDLKAHLKILKSRRDFLFDLWKDVTTVSQSIDLHRRLEEVQLDIDKIEGQLRFLNDQVSLSTLQVDIRETHSPAETDARPEVSNPSLGRAWDLGVKGFLNVVGTVLIGLGYLLPIGVLAGLAMLVIRLARRRGRAAS